MMNDPINFQKFKDSKKYAKVISDLTAIIRIYNLAIVGLGYFTKYSPVRHTIIELNATKVLLEVHLQKLKNSVTS